MSKDINNLRNVSEKSEVDMTNDAVDDLNAQNVSIDLNQLTENGLTFESMKVSSDIVTDATAVFPMWKLSPQQKRFIFNRQLRRSF